MGNVFLFCVTSVKYRKIFRVHPVQSITLLLMPEIFTNMVLSTILFTYDLLFAFRMLNVLTAIILVASAIGHLQVVKYERLEAVPKAGDYKLLKDEGNGDSDDEWVC